LAANLSSFSFFSYYTLSAAFFPTADLVFKALLILFTLSKVEFDITVTVANYVVLDLVEFVALVTFLVAKDALSVEVFDELLAFGHTNVVLMPDLVTLKIFLSKFIVSFLVLFFLTLFTLTVWEGSYGALQFPTVKLASSLISSAV
jgi:hypothetical protein